MCLELRSEKKNWTAVTPPQQRTPSVFCARSEFEFFFELLINNHVHPSSFTAAAARHWGLTGEHKRVARRFHAPQEKGPPGPCCHLAGNSAEAPLPSSMTWATLLQGTGAKAARRMQGEAAGWFEYVEFALPDPKVLGVFREVFGEEEG